MNRKEITNRIRESILETNQLLSSAMVTGGRYRKSKPTLESAALADTTMSNTVMSDDTIEDKLKDRIATKGVMLSPGDVVSNYFKSNIMSHAFPAHMDTNMELVKVDGKRNDNTSLFALDLPVFDRCTDIEFMEAIPLTMKELLNDISVLQTSAFNIIPMEAMIDDNAVANDVLRYMLDALEVDKEVLGVPLVNHVTDVLKINAPIVSILHHTFTTDSGSGDLTLNIPLLFIRLYVNMFSTKCNVINAFNILANMVDYIRDMSTVISTAKDINSDVNFVVLDIDTKAVKNALKIKDKSQPALDFIKSEASKAMTTCHTHNTLTPANRTKMYATSESGNPNPFSASVISAASKILGELPKSENFHKALLLTHFINNGVDSTNSVEMSEYITIIDVIENTFHTLVKAILDKEYDKYEKIQ